jgi:hypothetical protein
MDQTGKFSKAESNARFRQTNHYTLTIAVQNNTCRMEDEVPSEPFLIRFGSPPFLGGKAGRFALPIPDFSRSFNLPLFWEEDWERHRSKSYYFLGWLLKKSHIKSVAEIAVVG